MDVVKHLGVGIAVMLLRTREVRAASAAPRAQTMAKRAIRPELRFSQSRDFGIAGKRIFLLGTKGYRYERNRQRARE
jgi:hypothetical protein